MTSISVYMAMNTVYNHSNTAKMSAKTGETGETGTGIRGFSPKTPKTRTPDSAGPPYDQGRPRIFGVFPVLA